MRIHDPKLHIAHALFLSVFIVFKGTNFYKKNLMVIIIIIISLFNEDDILSYRLSNIWSSTMKLVQICLKTYIQYNKYTCYIVVATAGFYTTG